MIRCDGAQNRNSVIILSLVALGLGFAWRLFFSIQINLIPDECSYWSWSRRLDWSYFDNSGMVAYLIRLSTSVFGSNAPFVVRLPFLILSLATTITIYSTSVILFGDRKTAIIVAAMFNIMPVALLGAACAMHDNALMFFWSLGLWATAKLMKTLDGRWFYLVGVATGLAMQSKYTGVLLAPSVFVFLVWTKEYRGLLATKEPWLGLLLAFALVTPIIYWNVAHDWASLGHILFIGSGSLSWTRRITDGLGYHAAQFALVSPILYAALAVSLKGSFLKSIREPKPEYLLLLSFSLPLPLFGVMAFKGHVEANWAMMGYISAAVLTGQYVRNQPHAPEKNRQANCGYLLTWGAAFALVPAILVILHAWIGLIPVSIERRIAKDDRIIWETRGWAGLGKRVGGLVEPGDVIAADSYQLCALLEFNVPGNPMVRYLAPWRRPTQFDVWNPSFDDMKGKDILYVSPVKLLPSSDVRTTIYENFAPVEQLPTYSVTYHGEPIREIYVYRCHAFDPFSPRRLGPRSLFYREG
jgi:4-amino-4-deoxy-L-arabinose transferase-like glycosyltransferase